MPILEELLNDHSTTVLGSAVAALREMCPERLELLHPCFRKLVRLLADIDEWGQVMVLDIMTRYCRQYFVNPDPHGVGISLATETNFWGEDEEAAEATPDAPDLDMDFRQLLDAAAPLLQSRNAAVVLAVATLYYYCAPPSDMAKCGRALTRLVRTHAEISYLVLSNIASMATERPHIFTDSLSEFYIRPDDPLFSRKLKLDILTSLASEVNISAILEQFRDYARSEDKAFVQETVQAVGRCALSIPDVTPNCMRLLMSLIADPSEAVVAEAVVVMKKLLQLSERQGLFDDKLVKIVVHLGRLLADGIRAPMARASIVWVYGEYANRVAAYAPDVLRIMAKTFAVEADITKLQVLPALTLGPHAGGQAAADPAKHHPTFFHAHS